LQEQAGISGLILDPVNPVHTLSSPFSHTIACDISFGALAAVVVHPIANKAAIARMMFRAFMHNLTSR
jgi:hypothetical protein